MKKSGGQLIKKKRTMKCKHLRLLSSFFPRYRKVLNDGTDLGRCEGVIAPAAETGEGVARRRLRSKQKSYSLLRELVSWLSGPGDFFMDNFRRNFLGCGGFFHGAAPTDICSELSKSKVPPSSNGSFAETVCEGCCSCWHGR